MEEEFPKQEKELLLPDLEMQLVEGGTFQMGSEEEEAAPWEAPVHEVRVPSFYIAKYPVTQELWKRVMDNNPSNFKGAKRPVEQVSWRDIQGFIRKLNEKTSKAYRLLTEAEWEYAARGGKRSQGYKYAGSNKLKDVGWYEGNSYGETKPVGLKYPNELGIYDMSGNVYEWVEDQYHGNYKGAPFDDSAWVDEEQGAIRVIRGGGWDYGARYCPVSYRINYDPTYRYNDVGFRLGLSLQLVG